MVGKKSKVKHISTRKLLVLISLLIIIILFPIALYLYMSRSTTGVAWYSNDWGFRRRIDVSNSSGGTLTNEDVLVEMDTSSLVAGSKLQSDCDDLRFVDSDDNSPLSYWIEGGCNTASTKVWVRVPSLPNGGKEIFVYYGNPSASGESQAWGGNVIMFAQAACPTGWTRASDLDSRFLYGSATYGTTGGASSHAHDNASCTSSSISTTDIGVTTSGTLSGTSTTHTHTGLQATVASNSVLPPYADMVMCYSNQFLLKADLISMFDVSTPSGWTRATALDAKFPRGYASYGSTGGVATHLHTTAENIVTGGPSASLTSVQPFSATGGTVTTSGGYTIHTFTSSGTFTANQAGNVDVLVVAGGGGGAGGALVHGGGGGGGMLYTASFAVSSGNTSVTVGGGGAGGTGGTAGVNGGNSIFSTITRNGGGGGAIPSNNGLAGGNGGGAAGWVLSGSRSGGIASHGYNGGYVNGSDPEPGSAGGGGGGAGQAGFPGGLDSGNAWRGGAGGAGASSSITGTATYYAGGGGGSGRGGLNAVGGIGGGGSAGVSGGTNGLGGGGGGGGQSAPGFAGGSGVVIVRYPTPGALSGVIATGTHTHTSNDSTPTTVSNLPPYLEMVFAKADSDTYVNEDNVVIVSALPPYGWNRFTALDSKFAMGALNYGGTGGAATHTHSVSISAGGPSATVNGYGSGTNFADSTHTHSCTATTNAVSNLPTYFSVIYAQRKTSQATLINAEERPVPLAPTITQAEALSTTSIRWNFTDNATDEDGFKVYDASNNLMVTCEGANLTYCDETGLSTNTQYTRKVVAYNANGDSDYSSDASRYTFMSTPTISYGGNKTDNTIDLQSSGAINGSQMYFDCTGEGCDGGVNAWVSSTVDSATGLSSNTAYDFRVKSRNGDNVETAYSATVNIYTLASVPTISLDALGPSSISVSSSLSGLGQGSSALYFDCTGTNCDEGINEWVITEGDTVTGLSPNTEYTFAVKARNYDGTETLYSATESIYTLSDTPILSTGTISTTQIDLSSSLANIALGTSGLYFDCTGTGCDLGINEWIKETSDTATGLSPNTQYTFVVKGRNAQSVETVNSEAVNVYTLASVPTISADTVSSTSISFTVGNVSNLTEGSSGVYLDCLGTACDSGINEWIQGSSDVAIGLIPNTEYQFRIKARNASGTETAYSSPITVYTGAIAPSGIDTVSRSTESLRINLKSDTNSSATEYAILETTTNKYVNFANNTLSSSIVWGTRTDFGSSEGVLVTGLNSGTQYVFKTKARNTQNVETTYSPTTTIATKLYTPTVSSASENSLSSIRWNFTDINTNETGFRIYDGNGTQVLQCAQSNIQSCLESNLSANTEYTRYVRAYNAVSESDSSSVLRSGTLAQQTSIEALTNSGSGAVTMTLAQVAVSNVQIQDQEKALYYNGSVGVMSSLPSYVTYGRNVSIQGLLPNTQYTFRVRGFNVSGVATEWSSTQSITTYAQVPNMINVERISSGSVRVYFNNLSNPNNTQFAIKETNGNKYVDPTTGQMGSIERWGTFAEYGGDNGILVSNLDPSLQYGFSVRARNSENATTGYSNIIYIGTKAILLNIPQGISVALTDDADVVPTSVGDAQYGEQEIRIKEGVNLVADVQVLFSEDRDWSNVYIKSVPKESKAVVSFGSDSGVVKPFTMYVAQGNTNSFVICPKAKTLEDVSVNCSGGVKVTGEFPQTVTVENNKVSVSQVILKEVKYWIADGLVGTGGQGYISEVKEPIGNTISNVFKNINVSEVVGNVKGSVMETFENTPISDLPENELQNITVAATIATVGVSAGLALGSLSQMSYIFVQSFLGLLSALGFRRKRISYGFVYDSYSKEPLGGAVIRIFSSDKSLIETAVTDSAGKFAGNLEAGNYTISVTKRGYEFPSRFVKGEDYPIQNVYNGTLSVSRASSDVQLAIPIDRKTMGGKNKTLLVTRRILQKIFPILNIVIFCVGLAIYIYMYTKYPSTGNLLIGLIYIPAFFFLLRSVFGSAGKYGKVVNDKGKGIEGVSVVMEDVEFNRVVNKRVTEKNGRYRFIMNKGVYKLDIEDEAYVLKDISSVKDISVKKDNTIVTKKIVVRKI